MCGGFCLVSDFKPGTLAVSYIHTYALKSPYQQAHCGNCHDLIAFLILHLITISQRKRFAGHVQ